MYVVIFDKTGMPAGEFCGWIVSLLAHAPGRKNSRG